MTATLLWVLAFHQLLAFNTLRSWNHPLSSLKLASKVYKLDKPQLARLFSSVELCARRSIHEMPKLLQSANKPIITWIRVEYYRRSGLAGTHITL
jgi:hypothetical protein